jgi:YD repeat-containing protein
VALYQHNFRGQRVAKSAGGAVTHFHYDRWGHLIAESDAADNPGRRGGDRISAFTSAHGNSPEEPVSVENVRSLG